jgi:chromosome segregation ATPase
MMKEVLDANEAKEDTRLKEIKDEIKEDMNANKKSYRDLLARLEAKIDANQTNQMKTDDNQERMDVNLKEMREEIKSGQAEMKSTVGPSKRRWMLI